MRFDPCPVFFANATHEIFFVSFVSCAQLLRQAALRNILLPLLMIGLDVAITEVIELPWALAAYSLTVSIFIMISGRLGDIIGNIIFAVFSILTGIAIYAKNDIYFDIRRAMQGIGPATLLPNAVALITLNLVLFIDCWNRGSVTGWDKPFVYVLLIVSVIVMGAFIFIEKKTKEPVMPLSIWSVKGFPGVLACIALGWSSFGIFTYYIVQYLEVIRGATPLLTTAMLSPVVLSGLAAALSVSQLYGRIPAHLLLMGSMVFFCVGNVLIATVPPHQIYWAQVFVSTLVTPFGVDISFSASSLLVSNTMPTNQQGVAASMLRRHERVIVVLCTVVFD